MPSSAIQGSAIQGAGLAGGRPSVVTKLAYGFGSVAFGAKNNGFDYFLLIFYSQVMGVDASLVGMALLIALLFDAVSDPLIGYLSDNTHSRWGRRHPYMYAVALPVSLLYFFLWNPPGDLQGNELFPYLVLLAVSIRLLITFYEVPSSSLVAELTDDYDERTSLMSYRYLFGWTGGTLLATFALAFLLVDTDEVAGIFNVAGYGQYGALASVLIFIAIVVSALGTHNRIPYLRQPPPKRPMTLKRIFSELIETIATRSMFALFMAALFGAIATGVGAGLNYYINSYFWAFSTTEISYLSVSVVLSAIMAFRLSPWISKRMGKRVGAIRVGIVAFTVAPLAIFLRLLGLLPENGDPLLFPIVLVLTVFDVALIITFQTLMSAMIADAVEESELKTQRRSEGVFFAAISFSRKVVQGLGVVSATIILTLAQFPTGAAPGEVADEVVRDLGLYYAPTVFIVWMIMIAFLRLYRIDRAAHQANLDELERRSSV